jgi:hypothetical protein
MTDDLPPHPPPPPSGNLDAEPKKGTGCAYGGLAVVASAIGGSLLGGIISSITSDSAGALVGIISLLLPIGLLIAAAVRWRKIPGFMLGIGLTFAISAALFTACLAALTTMTF